MWVIRFLNGPLMGQSFPLKPGKNSIGRASDCDIQLNEKGLSKVHAELYALEDKIILTDQNSSNGSYINGVRVQSKTIGIKDKVSLHNILFDIHPVTAQEAQHLIALQSQKLQASVPVSQPPLSPTPPPQTPDFADDNFQQHADNSFSSENQTSEDNPFNQKKFSNLQDFFRHYIDDVALPGVYRLIELAEFRWILAGFILLLIVSITALSVVPMIQITKSSIEKESRRRALTIARNLAKTNEQALLQGVESAVTVEEASREEGVTTALIISHVDGHIIAPIDKVGDYADKPFIHNARRNNKEVVHQIDDSTIGTSVPIAFYNVKVGSYQVAAHAVILYNMGSLAVDDGRTISLFVQTLTMALIVGGLLFFFLYRLVEKPIIDLNKQLDEALKESTDNISSKYKFEAVEKLTENISSLLARAMNNSSDSSMAFQADKDIEVENLIRIMGCPAMVINGENGLVVSINEMFESVIDITIDELKEKGIEAIPDQAIQLNLTDLIERSQQQSTLIANNELELKGVNCELNAQAMTSKGQTEYIIITIQQIDGFEEDVA